MSYGLECVCGGEAKGTVCTCPKGYLDSMDRGNPRRVNVKEEIARRKQEAGPGVSINITDLVVDMMQPSDGFKMTVMNAEDAQAMMRKTQIDILAAEAVKGFPLTENQIARLRTWLEGQSRLHDGCIEFTFIPCSMGIIVQVKNSLNYNTIELTDYST